MVLRAFPRLALTDTRLLVSYQVRHVRGRTEIMPRWGSGPGRFRHHSFPCRFMCALRAGSTRRSFCRPAASLERMTSARLATGTSRPRYSMSTTSSRSSVYPVVAPGVTSMSPVRGNRNLVEFRSETTDYDVGHIVLFKSIENHHDVYIGCWHHRPRIRSSRSAATRARLSSASSVRREGGKVSMNAARVLSWSSIGSSRMRIS